MIVGLAIAAGALAAMWPWLGPWIRRGFRPKPPFRAMTSRAQSQPVRDLQFAEAAGTIDRADAARGSAGCLSERAFVTAANGRAAGNANPHDRHRRAAYRDRRARSSPRASPLVAGAIARQVSRSLGPCPRPG